MQELDLSNRKQIFELVSEHLGYDNSSLKRFEKQLFEPEFDEVFEELLEDATDNRKRWAVDENYLQMLDRGWEFFQSYFSSFCEQYSISYHNYRGNFTIINKDRIKLRKALIDFYTANNGKNFAIQFSTATGNKDYIVEIIDNHLNDINNRKLPKNGIEVVLSLNFADWFACSSGESWSSCLRLGGNYSYWAGLPGLIIDKNVAMLYITNRDKKSIFDIKDLDKIVSRSWILLDKKDNFGIVRWFPSNYLDIDRINRITKIHNKFYTISGSFGFISKYKVNLLQHTNGASSYIYMDATYFDNNFNHLEGSCGFVYYKDGECFEEDLFSLEGGLAGLIRRGTTIVEEGIVPKFQCYQCGDRVHEAVVRYFEDRGMCENCYDESVSYCDYCGDDHWNDDTQHIESVNETVCADCINEHFFRCNECKEYYYNDKLRSFEGVEYCEDCLNEMNDVHCCQSCKEYFGTKNVEYIETEDDFICHPCLKIEIDKKQLKLNFVA